MRKCEGCGVADRCVLDFQARCLPKLCNPATASDQDPLSHHDSCPKLVHEVIKYVKATKIEHTPAHPEGELSQKYRKEKWALVKNGSHWLRWKMLCRSCIYLEEQRAKQQEHYLKACKALRGDAERSYTSMLNASEW